MPKRNYLSRNLLTPWAKLFARNVAALTRSASSATRRGLKQSITQTVKRTVEQAVAARRPPAGAGDWIRGVAVGLAGARRYCLYRPLGVEFGEHLPLIVMLHGCGQDATSFAKSTRMNRVAARERFLVLYPEQDRLSNAQGCWNWFDSAAGRNEGEVALLMNAIDQVCLLYSVDRARVAVAGLSAGASMAALLVTRHPARFKAVVMHSGVPPGTARSAMTALGAMNGYRSTKPLKATPESMAALWPPLMVIHGARDQVVATSNGRAAAKVWANAAGARATETRSVRRGRRYEMTVTEFKRGAQAVSTLVEVAMLGHAWSGGAPQLRFSDERGPDASRMVWAFAAKQLGINPVAPPARPARSRAATQAASGSA